MKEDAKTQKKTLGYHLLSVVGAILCIIFVPILVVNIILIFKGFSNPEEVPGLGGIYPMIVLSGSMEDTIMTGDLIIGKEASIENVQVGDIVSFYEGESVITHRVIEIEEIDGEIFLTTKGDANNTKDAKKVSSDQLVGVYEKRFPGLGNAAMFMQTTQGLIICVILPIVLFLLYDMLRRKKYKRLEVQETDALIAEIEMLRAEKELLAKQVKNG